MRPPEHVLVEMLVFEGGPRVEAALEVARRVAVRLAPGAAAAGRNRRQL